jgi:hypothetical protein
MFLERVTGEPVMPVPTAIHFFSAVLDLLVFRNICSSKPSAHAVRRLRAASGPHADAQLRVDARGRDGGDRQKLAAAVKGACDTPAGAYAVR